MITVNQALKIHDLAIQKYGGSAGIRDLSLLESSMHRPFATFDNQELYPHAISQTVIKEQDIF